MAIGIVSATAKTLRWLPEVIMLVEVAQVNCTKVNAARAA
jgi:hypothetical protein